MPSLAEFTAQLERCAQSPDEIRAFIEAFSKVRLRYINHQLSLPSAPLSAAVSASVKPDWSKPAGRKASGVSKADAEGVADPDAFWLHVDVAEDTEEASRKKVAAFLTETCLSDKQRKALFPGLLAAKFNTPALMARRLSEVPLLNEWLRWTRTESIHPGVFVDYQRNLRIHGASQNAGGDVGAVGGAIAIVDALSEIAKHRKLEMLGSLPPDDQRDPLSVDAFLRRSGIGSNSTERPLKCVLLPNKRVVMFASDPDVAVIQSLEEPFQSAREAWETYSAVRSDARLRAQRIHEFAVGETKTATDPSNLHERMALSTRETRSERQADRFLMMAILTEDLLTGARGASGRRNTRAPMQSREMGRVNDVFNLHHAWGWDGGRERHPQHWSWFKRRLKEWTGL